MGWSLEAVGAPTGTKPRVALVGFPFHIGRRWGQSLVLDHKKVSNQHAVVEYEDGELFLRDLSSTNGTALNGERLEQRCRLQPGDVISFAGVRFTVLHEARQIMDEGTVVTAGDDDRDERERLQQRLAGYELQVGFQPIVRLGGGTQRRTIGYEALARATRNGTSCSPGVLFGRAAELAPELSRQLRDLALQEASKLPAMLPIFLNTHPRELPEKSVISSVSALRRKYPHVPFVLEIHENAAANLQHLKRLSAQLRALGVGLAYDDLGAGQARLLELVETEPRYVKFDRALVAGLPDADPRKQQLVANLVRMVRELGITPIAEGLETRGEVELCTALGFTHGQGWHFGRAIRAEQYQPRI